MAVAGPLNYQAPDSNGNPISGAKLYFFDAGTTNARNVYSDAGLTSVISQPVIANSAGWFQAIYIDNTAGNYKDRLHDASDVELRPDVDNIKPPVTGSSSLGSSLIAASTSSAMRTIVDSPSVAQHDAVDVRVAALESTVGDYIDTDEETLTWAASLEIDHASQSSFQVTLGGTTTFTITGLRDGGVFSLLMTQDGTGNRAATFSSDFVFRSSQLRVRKGANETTYITGNVIDGKVYCKVQDATPVSAVQIGKTDSGAPGTASTAAWTTLPLDAGTFYDDGTVVSGVTSNQITLLSGEYRFTGWQSIDNVGTFKLRLRDSGDTTTYGTVGGSVSASNSGRGNLAWLDTGRFTVAAQETFKIEYWASFAGSLGVNVTGTGTDNVNAQFNIERYT